VTTDTRSIIIDSIDRQAQYRSIRLPERFPRAWRFILAGADIAVIVFVSCIAFNGASNAVAAALVTAAVIAGIAWQSGLYSRSFAVFPRDEVYYACACVVLAAIPLALILAGVGQIPLLSIAVALVLSALASSIVRVRLHLERRPERPLSAVRTSLTPHGWAERESVWYRLSKRMYDLAVAAIVLTLFFPIMLSIAIAIVIESGQPVLFRQERVGESAAPFTIFKFRTMRTGAGPAWVRPGDDRITRVGAWLRRFSLDELPQIFNVIRGQMSIVGPRPEMVDFAHTFTESIPNYAQRHVVTPGITGWAQLYYKRNLTPDDVREVLPYDLFYVEYASVTLDCALTLKTICEVLFHRAV
jgi:lipopolysaccharide/colanic/teichoic acid biosynthesis glycosyltransferase